MKKYLFIIAALCCTLVASAQTKLDALLFSSADEMDESYLLSDGVSVSFEDGIASLSVNGEDRGTLGIDNGVRVDFSKAFMLTANQDPDHTDDYYSTFYTSEGAYWLPEDETAKAYICLADGNVGMMTNVGSLIHKGEAVLLKAQQNSILLMPSANVDAASEDNIFEGTDESMTLGANQYAFSYGTNGIGFYIWEGKEIGANKTYFTLDSEMPIVKFEYDDGIEGGTTAIDNVSVNVNDNVLYNLNGVRVGADYKGIVIKNGKKYYQK